MAETVKVSFRRTPRVEQGRQPEQARSKTTRPMAEPRLMVKDADVFADFIEHVLQQPTFATHPPRPPLAASAHFPRTPTPNSESLRKALEDFDGACQARDERTARGELAPLSPPTSHELEVCRKLVLELEAFSRARGMDVEAAATGEILHIRPDDTSMLGRVALLADRGIKADVVIDPLLKLMRGAEGAMGHNRLCLPSYLLWGGELAAHLPVHELHHGLRTAREEQGERLLYHGLVAAHGRTDTYGTFTLQELPAHARQLGYVAGLVRRSLEAERSGGAAATDSPDAKAPLTAEQRREALSLIKNEFVPALRQFAIRAESAALWARKQMDASAPELRVEANPYSPLLVDLVGPDIALGLPWWAMEQDGGRAFTEALFYASGEIINTLESVLLSPSLDDAALRRLEQLRLEMNLAEQRFAKQPGTPGANSAG